MSLGALAIVAVLCVTYAWRLGTFDGLMRGTPAAPKAGHWQGANPALSFDVGADGWMAHVKLDVENLPYASCSVWASVIQIAPDQTFASSLGTDPSTGNLLRFDVEMQGTFYGTTAYGTYKPRACGGIASGGNRSDGKWSAAWQHP